MRVLALAFCFAAVALSADWTRFRGPDGSGLSPETSLPAELAPSSAAWKVKTPRGHSSPIVAGGRIYITAHEGDERIVLCLDAKTGEPVWKRSDARGESSS